MFTEVSDASQVAEARRKVGELAVRVGLAQTRVDEVAIVVTELATNLVKHGGGGHIHASRCDDAGGVGLEVLALDRGGGMANPGRCLQDGYSTAGSPGNGLGAIARLTDTLQIYTRAGQGCVLMCRFMTQAVPARHGMLGATLAPYPGELVCGDNWSWSDTEHGPTLMLADGSGHGIEAARAADMAAHIFLRYAGASCEELVGSIHRALAPTRGAALAVARIDRAAKLVRFVGLGNIGAVLVSPDKVRRMVSHNGTAGHVAPRIREFTYEFTGDPVVIMHSDGLRSRWNLDHYPGLLSQHPSVIAAVLLRDHRRGRDDASVVVMANTA